MGLRTDLPVVGGDSYPRRKKHNSKFTCLLRRYVISVFERVLLTVTTSYALRTYFSCRKPVNHSWGRLYDGHNFAMNPLYFNSAVLLFD